MRSEAEWRAAVGVVVVAGVVRLVLAAVVPLVPDEAYYWEWSRHLALGYFDHPAAIAWLIAAASHGFCKIPAALIMLAARRSSFIGCAEKISSGGNAAPSRR